MDYQKICIFCMKEKKNISDACPHCGRNPAEYTVRPYALPPFTILHGKYLIGVVLGAGGFGITYIALDLQLERKVAIKEFFMQGSMYRLSSASSQISIVRSDALQDQMVEINRVKFVEEAKTLAKLEHLPGIVGVYEYFQENNTAYIALEYLNGLTLKAYVKKNGGRIPLDDVSNKLLPVINSLSVLHDHNILHRDISPDNIMIMSDGGMKLFDFGGAKELRGDDERSAVVMKKAGYTPQEQYFNRELGPWTDEYALAATIYYCITGQVPVESIARSNEADPLQLPSSLGIVLPKKQEAALMKALAIRPGERYNSIQEFKEAFILPPHAPHDSGKEKKRPALWIPFLAVISCAAVVAVLITIKIMSDKKKEKALTAVPAVETVEMVDTELNSQKEVENSAIIEKKSSSTQSDQTMPQKDASISSGEDTAEAEKSDTEITEETIGTHASTEKLSSTPTEEATSTPTEETTPTPTEEATPTPTEEATPTPTEEATPTPTPTEEATPTPTEEPTPTPTEEPTPTPTEEPTPTPTEEPTPTPTEKSEGIPTVAPVQEVVFETDFSEADEDDTSIAPTEESVPEPTPTPTTEPVDGPVFVKWENAGLMDHPINFSDINAELKVRDLLKKQEGDIMLSDLWNKKELVLTPIDENHQIHDIGFVFELKNLQSIVLNNNAIEDLSPLAYLENLEGVFFNTNHVSDISPLIGHRYLAYVDMSNNPIIDLSYLSMMPSLKTIHLFNVGLNDSNFDFCVNYVCNLPVLDHFDVGGNSITDFTALRKMANLEQVSVWVGGITDSILMNLIDSVAYLPKLKVLSLTNNNITDPSPFVRLQNLEEINLSTNQITDVSAFLKMPNLKRLNLRHNQVTNLEVLSSKSFEELYTDAD